jgi:hypothetical protein
MKCKNCSYQFDPLKEAIPEEENVECVALEILILSDQKKNMKEICYLLWLNHNNNKI